MTEDEMVGWHHQLNGHEFERALGIGEGQGSLACCSPWAHKESDTTGQMNNKSVESKNMTQMNLSTRQKETQDKQNRLVEERWSGRLELVDVSYYIWNG